MRLLKCLAALSFAVLVPSLLASPVPYSNIGHIAPQTPTYAVGSGGVDLYFVSVSASFTDYIEVYDVQTKYKTGELLDNQTSTVGSEVVVGSGKGQINAGDQLIFYIESPEGQFASIGYYSADSVSHAYIAPFAGGTVGKAKVPAGVYIGFEDEANGKSDLDYNDEAIIVTGVTTTVPVTPLKTSVTATPEPGSLILLGTGLVSVAGVARRRFKGAVAA